MPSFSAASRGKLFTCKRELQILFLEVIKHVDCTVLCGHRGKVEQEEAFRSGRSKLQFPQSLHNGEPSLAIDVVPHPIDWDDLERFRAFGGFVLGVASQQRVLIRWGGDWDGDWQFRDQSLIDLPHFELR